MWSLPHFDPVFAGCCAECIRAPADEKLCRGCGQVYCSTECQHRHWKGEGRVKSVPHRAYCPSMRAPIGVDSDGKAPEHPLRCQLFNILDVPAHTDAHQRVAQNALALAPRLLPMLVPGHGLEVVTFMRHLREHGVDDAETQKELAAHFSALTPYTLASRETLLILFLGLLHIRAATCDAFAQMLQMACAIEYTAPGRMGAASAERVGTLRLKGDQYAPFMASESPAQIWRLVQSRHVALLVTLMPRNLAVAGEHPESWVRLLIASAPACRAIVVSYGGAASDAKATLGSILIERFPHALRDSEVTALLAHVDALAGGDAVGSEAAAAHLTALRGAAGRVDDELVAEGGYHAYTAVLNLGLTV